MRPSPSAWLLLAVLGAFIAGCAEETANATPKRDKRYIDPNKYYGTYVGKRLDKDTGKGEEGDSILVINQGNSTYTMTHEGLKFGGNYAYLSGEMELYVYNVEGRTRKQIDGMDAAANKAAGREPSTPEKLTLYKDIIENTKWRFEVLPDGFRMKASNGKPALYEFHRLPVSGGRGGGGGGGAADMSIDGAPTSSRQGGGSGPNVAPDQGKQPEGDWAHGISGMGGR